MGIQTLKIVQKANELVDALGTREPHRIAHALGIEIIPVAFRRQRGAYRVLLRNRFIFIKNDLDPVLENIVLLHEIGHDVLHREEAMRAGSFDELDSRKSRMEYEANVFAAQVSLEDEKILEYIRCGYELQQIACAMHTDVNLAALKINVLIEQGHCLRRQKYDNGFLRGNREEYCNTEKPH